MSQKWALFRGHFGGRVVWFRIKGYGVAAMRVSLLDYHKPYIHLFGWRVEFLAP